jgi:ParB family chromosome partitioning protein
MRHDSHFVEEITSHRPDSVGRMIPIDRIEPNPHQPRRHIGDLSEMVASIKEKGILEPILVRADDGRFQIIAGERRYQAAKKAGLQHLPCIEVDVDNRGMLEISLIENLQRKDLSPFEEAAAIQRLSDQFRYTHEEIARKLGKSRTVITEALSLNRMPEEIQERCRRADIVSKSMLLQIVRLEKAAAMHRLIDRITGEGMTRDQAREYNRASSPRRPRTYTFKYKPEDDDFQFSLTFKKSEVDRHELIETLQSILKKLIESPDVGALDAGRTRERAERPGDSSTTRKRGGNGRESRLPSSDWSRP